MKTPIVILIAVISLAIGVGTGVAYQRHVTPAFVAGMGRGAGFAGGRAGGPGGANRGPMNGGRVAGEILTIDNGSLTVKLPDGGSKLVLVSNSAKVVKATESTLTDLKVGDQVSIFGSSNQDGSVTAQSVQIGSGLGSGFTRPDAANPVTAPVTK